MSLSSNIFKNIMRSIIDLSITTESIFVIKHIETVDSNSSKSRRRVLILRKDGIGDCVIFYPMLKTFREYYKDAEITLIFPRYLESLAPLFGADLIDRVIWFDHKDFSTNFRYRRRFLLDLKKAGYDIAIYPVFSRERIGDVMMKMTCAKEIIGFGLESCANENLSLKKDHIYTRLIHLSPKIRSEIKRDECFVEQLTSKRPAISFPTFNIDKLPKEKSYRLIGDSDLNEKPYAVIFPGAGAPYRIWPVKRFALVIDYVSSKGFTPVICGSQNDAELSGQIVSQLKCKIVNLSGKTDLATLSHILKKSKFYFGSDTGVLHLAIAVGIPTIALVGVGGYLRFFPYGDLEKNRMLYNDLYMKSHGLEIGDWEKTSHPMTGEAHPSILGITVGQAVREIDYMIQYVNSHEKKD